MVMYKNLNIDFITRTKDILIRNIDEPYDVTLLINCCIGLLVVPNERLIDSIPNSKNLSLFNVQDNWIEVWKGKKTLRKFIKKIRNGITHFHIEFNGTESLITEIVISDIYHGDLNFKIRMSLNEFKNFVITFSNYILNVSN